MTQSILTNEETFLIEEGWSQELPFDLFMEQCPASKAGKPLDPKEASKLLKEDPGSVCVKQANEGRSDRKERKVFYKTNPDASSKQKTDKEGSLWGGTSSTEQVMSGEAPLGKTSEEVQQDIMARFNNFFDQTNKGQEGEFDSDFLSELEENPDALEFLVALDQILTGECTSR